MSEGVVKLEDVSFAYADGRSVLEHVNLTIHQGDFACVVGPNGGGKTTLLRLILGLLQPSQGRVTVFGQSPQHVRGRIGYVPQHHQFDPQFPVRVFDVVLMGRLHLRRGIRTFHWEDRAAAMQALERVGMADRAGSGFSELSGGQRQRTLVARALAGHPDIVLLDEPTAHADVVVSKEITELLLELNKAMTILFVSHDLGFVSHPIKSVICVNRKVVSHPAMDITAGIISEMYGQEVHMVQHRHMGEEETCPNS